MENVQTNLADNGVLSTAQIAVLLSAIAYSKEPQQDIDSYLPGWKIVWNGNQTIDGNYAFIATDPKEECYVLSIRGSLPPSEVFKCWDSFANWILEDLNVIKQVNWPYVTSGNALVSWGTSIAFNNVLNMQDSLGSQQLIFDYLKEKAVTSGKQVIITGHSLGGNIANSYASYFVTSLEREGYTYSKTALYTFAAPAAGNGDFAVDLDHKIPAAWHYENTNDIVPKFPVSLSILLIAFLYIPAPAASEITVTLYGKTFSLREAISLLAGAFYLLHYQQQSRNYNVFPNPLDEAYENNTVEDWLEQAGSQHALSNYANYLGVKLDSKLDRLSRII